MNEFDRFDGKSQDTGNIPGWEPTPEEPDTQEQPKPEKDTEIHEWRLTDGVMIGTQEPPKQEDVPYSDGQASFYAQNIPDVPKKKNGAVRIVAVVIAVVLVFSALAFVGYLMMQSDSAGSNQEPILSQPSDNNENSMVISPIPDSDSDSDAEISADARELTSEEIAEKVMPSVVGVVVYTTESARRDLSYSEGSGIIMSEDGFIITNAHVVVQDDADSVSGYKTVDKVEVYLDTEEYYEASIIGVDLRTDLAVVKIDRTGLAAAEFGDSESLKIGEKAIAIGNPTGRLLSSSFTQGVVSGINRSIEVGMSGYTMDCIQTDAAINPGNSGGALVNKYGQVIGINSSKIVAAEYEGIGFAIPIHEAKPVVDSLIANGYVADRVRIGITFRAISEAMAELTGTPAGLRVVTVDEETDAYQKGLRSGDIITHMDGEAVYTLDEISELLEPKKPGDTMILTVYRLEDNEERTFDIEVRLEQDTSALLP